LGVAAVALHFGRNQFVLPACVVIPHPPEPLVSNFSCIESALRTMREKRSATAALLYTGRHGLIAVGNVLGIANIGCVRASKTVSSATRRSSEAVYLGTNAAPRVRALRQKAVQKSKVRFAPERRPPLALQKKENPVKKPLVILSFVAALVLASVRNSSAQSATSAPAQSESTAQSVLNQNIELLRQDLRSKKKQLVAANLTLSDAEATKFWPVYDQYVAELTKINDEKYAILKEYADTWGNMNNEQALSLTKRSLAVEQQVTELRIKYVPIFTKVVSGTTVATFFQIERRVQALVDLQLGSQLPLVQAQN
jgi:hypothetical protein